MPDFLKITGNSVLIVALAACFSAQFLKFLVGVVIEKKFHLRTLFETGGMPSSHSAFVAAMAAGVGASLGWDSPEFAIAVVVATIVMYDASGVRQEAGKHAKVLNRLIDQAFTGDSTWEEGRLKELLGHTSAQVFAGAMWGVAVFGLAKWVV
ncbi:MAG: divergent PAP2 family protein [Leptolyngbyaceae bacterium]|nr:divergent PAP2 family protein [Leptolyngbyaceae bacterium]